MPTLAMLVKMKYIKSRPQNVEGLKTIKKILYIINWNNKHYLKIKIKKSRTIAGVCGLALSCMKMKFSPIYPEKGTT